MRIAINGRLLIRNRLEGIGYFTWEVLKQLIHLYPENDYLVLFDRKPAKEFMIPGVEFRVLKPAARHPVLYRVWFDLLIPWHLRTWDAEVFLSFDGFTSQHLHIPAITAIHDLAYLHFPDYMKSSDLNYYIKYQPKFAHLSEQILTVSHYSAKDIAHQYGIPDHKINVVYNGSRFEKSPPEDNPNILKNYGLMSGHYFIYTGSLHPRKNISKLIKAFELSDAATQHEAKLVLAGRPAWKTDEMMNDIRQSPFSGQILSPGYISDADLWNLLKHALGMCYVSLFEGFGVPVLDAFHARIPVLCSQTTSVGEIAGEAALQVDPQNTTAITLGMDRLHQDANLRQHLVRRGTERSKRFGWALTTRKIHHVIEEVYTNFQ